MFQMVSSGIIFDHFAAQGHQDALYGQFRYNFGNYFGANAAQMIQAISFGIFLNPFGPKTAIFNHLLSD